MMASFIMDVLDNLSTMAATDIDLCCVVCNYALDCLGREKRNVQRFACVMSLMLVFESFVVPIVARLGEGKEQKKMARWTVARLLRQLLGLSQGLSPVCSLPEVAAAALGWWTRRGMIIDPLRARRYGSFGILSQF